MAALLVPDISAPQVDKLAGYSVVRKRIRTGDLMEFRSQTAIGWAIRAVTKQPVNHSALCLDLNRYEGLQHRRFILEALEGGIDLCLISDRLEAFSGSVWWYPLKPEFNHKRERIGSWAIQQKGKKYDFGSLFKNLLGRVNADARKLFCSEYYFMALREAGILSGDKAPRPGEFAQYGVHQEPERIM